MRCVSIYPLVVGVLCGSQLPYIVAPESTTERLEHLAGDEESTVSDGTRPNVLLVVVDDLGWKDIGFHDSTFSTPHLNTMASEGVELSTFYTAPTCTPSRAQLMTGRYSFRIGMQDSVIHSTEPRGVPLSEKFLSEKLQTMGYSTAMVGKWHLGMHMPQYLPEGRGFDEFYGILTGGGGHYSHMSVSQDVTPRGERYNTRIFTGPNIIEGEELSPDNFGSVHSTELYSTRAAKYLASMSEDDRPWFLYLSYQAIHDPIETDEQWTTGNSCEYISKEASNMSGTAADEVDWDMRKTVCGMVAQIDDGVGRLRIVLENLGEWDNTVVIFFSDNGGLASHGSLNHPFRGAKGDLWEGGVHVPAFISGGYLTSTLARNQVQPYRYGHLTHVTDVHATVLGLAGYRDSDSALLDGIDLWQSLVETTEPAREAVVINVNSPNFASCGAVRWGRYKLIRNPEPSDTAVYTRVKMKLGEHGLQVSESVLDEATAEVHKQLHLSEPRMYLFDLEANPSESVSEDCGLRPKIEGVKECSNLYDIPAFRDVRRKLEGILKHVEAQAVPPSMRWTDDGPLADPLNFGGWIPWRDENGDPLALYDGLTYSEEYKVGSGVVLIADPEEVVSGGEPHPIGAESGIYRISTSASGIAMLVASLVVGSTWLAYRAGRRNGYEKLVK